MDRCQALWAKRYWLEKTPIGRRNHTRKGLFISVGATKGKKLFEGTLLSIRYFFDVLDIELWRSLLYHSLDLERERCIGTSGIPGRSIPVSERIVPGYQEYRLRKNNVQNRNNQNK